MPVTSDNSMKTSEVQLRASPQMLKKRRSAPGGDAAAAADAPATAGRVGANAAWTVRSVSR